MTKETHTNPEESQLLEQEPTLEVQTEGANEVEENVSTNATDLVNDGPLVEDSGNVVDDSFDSAKEETDYEDDYYAVKAQDHQRIESLIEQAENELADLKLRKSIMEADFSGLLAHYRQLILTDQDISVIAKKTLLEYYAYEFLKPLKTIHLTATDNYDTWKTKHFNVRFRLTETKELEFSFKLNPVNSTYQSNYLPLLTINSNSQSVVVNDEQILHLISQWHAENIFSVNQLSLFNYDVNLVLAHLKELGFTVSPSLIDNTQTLAVDMETDFAVAAEVLDQIFIITMENQQYDFITENKGEILVLLDKNQRLTIHLYTESTLLTIDSDQWKRSLLDFFTSYPFLVPLVVEGEE